jgi:hypothetical protein
LEAFKAAPRSVSSHGFKTALAQIGFVKSLFLTNGRRPRHDPPWLFFPFAGIMASLLRFHYSFLFLSFFLVSAASHFSNNTILYDPSQPHLHSFPRKISRRSCHPSPPPLPNNCFPAVGFNTPSGVPASTDGWWCDPDDEFGFLGFSYEITTCQFPDLSFSSFRPYESSLFLIRSKFDPTTDRFLKHATDL